MEKYTLQSLDCANCAAKIENAVQQTPGVKYASVDFATATLYLDTADFPAVKQTIKTIEPQINILTNTNGSQENDGFDVSKKLLQILLGAILFFGGLIFIDLLQATPYGLGEWLVFCTAYLISGYRVVRNALRNISRGQVFDEQFLMTTATIGAILIGELPEAVGVMLFYMVGEFAQELSVSRSRRSIQALLEVRPDHANLIKDGKTQKVTPDEVQVGDFVMIRPGEKIPLDGEVVKGASRVDTSPLTGESLPRNLKSGDLVFAGTINQTGLLTVKVTQPFEKSSVSKILELVENAGRRKARTEKFITRFARFYSPVVVGLAAAVAVLPPLITGAPFTTWLYRALVVLVISCPCALVISIPLGYFGGVGGASRRGILVKGSRYLDALAAVRTVVLDKTGTLTRGTFKVKQLQPSKGFSEDDLISFAAEAEAASDHPIAESIRNAYGGSMNISVGEYQEIAGQGVIATVGGRELLAGSDDLLHRSGIWHDHNVCDVDGTVVHVAVDGEYAGYMVIADELKSDTHQAIQDLRANGIQEIVMLTGDAESTAKNVANELGVDCYRSGLLPEDKVDIVEKLMNSDLHIGKLAYVGDGINDAPALARSDVGIAMGALGSEAAIETADVVIMTDSLSKVAEGIHMGRRTRAIVWQNITIALLVKIIFIALGVAGIANMWLAVIGDMGVALLAVANSMRVLRVPSVE
jgi:Cd2+/Zn2+-exporting ATPase